MASEYDYTIGPQVISFVHSSKKGNTMNPLTNFRLITLFPLLFVFIQVGHSDTLTGRLINASQKSISGCLVEVSANTTSGHSDNEGRFILSGLPSSFHVPKHLKGKPISHELKGGMLFFTKTPQQHISIDILRPDGKYVGNIPTAGLKPGNYRIDPLAYIKNKAFNAIYLLSIRSGKSQFLYRMPPLFQSGRSHKSTEAAHASQVTFSKKTQTALDTLSIFCEGYTAKTIDLNGYNNDLGDITMAKSPNILLALADDVSYRHMGPQSAAFIQTPHFDRVARDGIFFKHGFTPNPKCSPSRASLLTGLNSWQLEEAGNHHGIFPNKFEVYTLTLESVGYAIGFTGKGWSPGSWSQGGFTHNPAGHPWNQITKEADRPGKGISTYDYAENFKAFLNSRKAGQPFCFWYGEKEAHRGYEYKSGVKNGKKLKDAEIPAFWPDVENIRHDILDYAVEVEWFDNHLGRMLHTLDSIGELDNTLVIVTADNGMPFPRVKGNPYEMGHHMPLSMMWGNEIKPGRVVEDFISFIDFAPTFLELAGIKARTAMEGRSLLNLLQSDKSGQVELDRSFVITGKERHDILRTDPDSGWTDVGYPIRTIRNNRYLYLRNFKEKRWPAGDPGRYKNVDGSPTKTFIVKNKDVAAYTPYFELNLGMRPAEELYDIVEDPDCVNNLATHRSYAGLKDSLWNFLKNELIRQGDPRVLGAGDIFDKYLYIKETDGCCQ